MLRAGFSLGRGHDGNNIASGFRQRLGRQLRQSQGRAGPDIPPLHPGRKAEQPIAKGKGAVRAGKGVDFHQLLLNAAGKGSRLLLRLTPFGAVILQCHGDSPPRYILFPTGAHTAFPQRSPNGDARRCSQRPPPTGFSLRGRTAAPGNQ